jgi:hypothetical protein
MLPAADIPGIGGCSSFPVQSRPLLELAVRFNAVRRGAPTVALVVKIKVACEVTVRLTGNETLSVGVLLVVRVMVPG